MILPIHAQIARHPELVSGSVLLKDSESPNGCPTDTSSQGSLRIACSFCKVQHDKILCKLGPRRVVSESIRNISFFVGVETPTYYFVHFILR